MTTNATVSLASALLLRDVFGYSVGPMLGFAYVDGALTLGGSADGARWVFMKDGTSATTAEFAVAPDPFTALNFLEEQHGYKWARSPQFLRGEWQAGQKGFIWDIVADSPDALIAAIAEHHRQHAGSEPQEATP